MNQIKMEAILKQFCDELENSKIDTCELGSCQYQNVNIAYTYILKALTLDRTLFEELFGITYDKELTLPEFIAKLKEIAQDEYLDMDEDDKKEFGEPKIESIEDFYQWCRDMAYDLWSARIQPFNGFQMRAHIDMPEDRLPIINQMIQEDEAWETAIDIAYTSFIHGTNIKTFADFST